MPEPGQLCADADACIDATIAALGGRLVIGTPIGTGKPNHLLNAFYRRAIAEPELSLTIITGLTLRPPTWHSELERLLVAPIRERLYAHYPELEYARARAAGALPDNVRVIEFYSAPGELLDDMAAQRDHASINYSEVAEVALARGLNVLAQLVSPGPAGLSLSCNPDSTLGLLPKLLAQRAGGRPVRLLAQLCSKLPYMPGPSVVAPEIFDMILDEAGHELEPFPIPSRSVGTAAHCIGLHASALIRDGGTIQLGIGQLGDALAHALILRHEQSDAYRELLAQTPEHELGGREPFVRGLYAASEMLSEGLFALYQRGILSRRVHDDVHLQQAIDASEGAVDWPLFERLREAGFARARLIELGVLRSTAPCELAEVEVQHLGDRLRGGVVADAGFFLGSQRLYRGLCELDLDARAELRMQPISYVNSLFDQPELKAAQRRHARLVNIGMKVTLAGAVASDALADGRYVSGVGGQHDFATMAHCLPEARFILLVPAVRMRSGALESNIVFDYGHHTLPDHLRDIVVTEYGIADVRGRTVSEVAEALIGIADARVQPELVRAAKHAGRLRSDWQLPDRARANVPERLEQALAPHRARGLLPRFPLGTDLSAEEVALQDALEQLRDESFSWRDALRAVSVPQAARPYLERMQLAEPKSLRERVLQRVLVVALARARLLD